MKVKNRKTYYQIILDKSGSMCDCINSTINGFNEQMQMIKSLQNKFPDQEVLVSLTTFNHDIDFDVVCSRPSDLKEMVLEQNSSSWIKKPTDYVVYSPNGMTALYDAIGKSVKKIQHIAKEEIENNEGKYDEHGFYQSRGWSESGNSAIRRGKEFFDKYLKDKTIIDIGCGFDPITENAFPYDTKVNEQYGHRNADMSCL